MVVALHPSLSFGQEMHQELQGTTRAQVVEVVAVREQETPGLGFMQTVQTVHAEFLEGPRMGDVVTFDNDRMILEKGDVFFMNYFQDLQGLEWYNVSEPDRRVPLAFFVGLFVVVVLVFGGWQGLRSLFALAGSFAFIFLVLFPQLIAGMSPVVISTGVAILVLVSAILITHGINRISFAALLGTSTTVCVSIALAYLAVDATHLTGFIEDTSTYLNLNTGGTLDFKGLLLGAMIIGILGILDDVAITQAAGVREFFRADPSLSRTRVYHKAMRIGREHVGALVNTLALTYVGAAMPLLLFFYQTGASLMVLNREVFAVEIVRTVVGSIGIVLAVPITTLIAVYMFAGRSNDSHDGVHVHHHHH